MSVDTPPGEQTPMSRSIARTAAGAYDDAQEARKAMYNRVRDVVRKRREGIPFDETEDKKPPDERDFSTEYEDSNLPDLIEEMHRKGQLNDDEEKYLSHMMKAGQEAKRIENTYEAAMGIAAAEPIYYEWLEHVYGVSTTLTAKLIHQLGYCGPAIVVDTSRDEDDPYYVVAREDEDGYEATLDAAKRAKASDDLRLKQGSLRASDAISYCGYAPGQRRRRGEKLDHNPKAKTLLWNVSQSMIYQGDDSRYKTEFYDPYKAEQIRRMKESRCYRCGESAEDHTSPEDDPQHYCDDGTPVESSDFEVPDAPDNATPPWRRGHADARARRYLAKKFLQHYWECGRRLRGLEVPDHYVLGPGGHEKRTDTFEHFPYAIRELTGSPLGE